MQLGEICEYNSVGVCKCSQGVARKCAKYLNTVVYDLTVHDHFNTTSANDSFMIMISEISSGVESATCVWLCLDANHVGRL